MSLVLTETHGRVGLVRLNRPEAYNALSPALIDELGTALRGFEANPEIGAIVITGFEKAFAAGADIKNMASQSFSDIQSQDFITDDWEVASRIRIPVIAAVSGVALGGGCELAMMCDLIVAAPNAKFGQPEIKIGTIPGAGGTQRLTRAIGKAKAMDMCLTGRLMGVEEAEKCGLVARVLDDEDFVSAAIEVAQEMAGMSRPLLQMCKEAVNQSFESSLASGVMFERRLFHSTFGLDDREEGMKAFAEKREPKWAHK